MRNREARATFVHVIAWIHAAATCTALMAYALPGASFSNFFWVVYVGDALTPLCFIGLLTRGQAMADWCCMLAGVFSVLKTFSLIVAVAALAHHSSRIVAGDETSLCAGAAWHLIVLMISGGVSIVCSVIELFRAHQVWKKTHCG